MFAIDNYLQLCDFGCSSPIKTELREKVGTRLFQAPEMFDLGETKSYKVSESEVFAFGCTLFTIMFQ